MDQSVTFILNGFKRPQYLTEQYRAIAAQTIRPTEIMLWQNDAGEAYHQAWKEVDEVVGQCATARANRNLGVWARFAFALNAMTEYVCIVDDDTIPGARWIENCFDTLKTHRGLLGTRGVIFKAGGRYEIEQEVGVFGPNEETRQVDIVTHNWFFERDWLSSYWREMPPPGFERAGEDIHLCYTLQKYQGLATYVPPHPDDDLTRWGSHPVKSLRYGSDREAIWRHDGLTKMNDYLQIAIAGGFKLINASDSAQN